jgi:phytoene dehydrogenase-like protein
MDELQLHKMDENGYDKITFGDDETEYPHAQGYRNFVEQLSKYFPEERDNLEDYCEEIQRVCNQFPRYNLVGKDNYNEEILHLNTKRFIESLTSNKKLSPFYWVLIFYMPEILKTFRFMFMLTVNSYIQSAYKCIKGGSQISKLLIRRLREYGAEVHKHAEVSEFIFNENNMLSGVKTSGGKEYFAKNSSQILKFVQP